MIDNNEFKDLDSIWDDSGSSWGTEDLTDLHRLLDDEGQDAFPDEQAVDSLQSRRQQEPQSRSRRSEKPQKPRKEPAKKAKAEKTRPKKEKPSGKKRAPAEPEDPFAGLPAMQGSKEKRVGLDDGQGKKGKKGKKEKPPKPPKDPEKAKRAKLTFTVFAVVLSLIFIGATVGGYMVTANPNSFPNVYIGGLFAGNMSREQIDAVLMENKWDEQVGTTLLVQLPAEVSFELNSCQSGAKLTREQAVDAALRYGHDSNWYENLFRYLLNYIGPVDIDLVERPLNEDYIRQCMAEGTAKLDEATADTGYTVDEKAELLRLRKGAGQIRLDEEALYERLCQALRADSREIQFTQLTGSITMPDFQKIHDELAVEPADAYFNEDFTIVPEINGCWFQVAEAEDLWKAAEPGDLVEIPLELTYPENTEESLSAMLYRDKLGSQTTYYTWSTDNRISNINLVAEKLNGHIMMPGDVFSYNEFVGQRTKEAGFLEAGAYDNGEVVQEVGGGICQVSSTLYCATMYAQLETVERTNHYFKVDYLDYGLDATVSWPKPDFKFKNCRDYPVKIVAYCDNEEKALTIEIWGTDVDGTYVTLRSSKLVVYDSVYVNTAVGYGVSAYRTVYDAEGNFLYEVEEPYGIYYRHDEDIQWPAEKYADSGDGG
ncbi:MAG: VanW family protein [Candidatus Limivicinus sp.]